MSLSQGPGLMLSDELVPADFLELVEVAERVGYEELWYTDQRFWRDSYAGLALAAQHSRTLRLGPGVNDPFTRHPATIAMSIATLDEISGGRAQLGLGVGGSGIAEMRLPKVKPVRALREAVELIRVMLTGERVDYDGELFHLDGGKLGFKPVRTSIPIYVASHGPQVLKLCGRLVDGVLLGNMARPEAVREAAALIREGEHAAGRPPGSVVVNLRLEACVCGHHEASLLAMKRRFAVRLIAYFPQWEFLEPLGVQATDEMRQAARARDVEELTALISDADVRATALVGSPASAAAQLTELLTPEVGRLTIRPYSCGQHGLEPTVRVFAEEVWPEATARARSVSRASASA